MSDENLFGDPDLPHVWKAAATKGKGRKRAERAKDETKQPGETSTPAAAQATTNVHKEGDDMPTQPESEPKREKKRPTFEETYKKLEKIIADLERDDIPLDELLSKFQEGVGYVRECTKFINDARLKIEQFVEQKDGSWVIKNLEQ
jgi:exodeoxyribonuclease VII small subunit